MVGLARIDHVLELGSSIEKNTYQNEHDSTRSSKYYEKYSSIFVGVNDVRVQCLEIAPRT